MVRSNRLAVRSPCSTRVAHGVEQAVRLYTFMNEQQKVMNVKKDGRQIGRENEIRVLRALHRFGWLRTRDLAALCWKRWASKPSSTLSWETTTPTASAMRMAQRTLRRLRKERHVINAQAPDGSIIYGLSEGGARRLQGAGVSAISSKDLVRNFSTAYYRHRCIANEIAISGIVQGYRASTEREVAQGAWLGGEKGIEGKRPDVLLRDQNRIWWVEVEKSRKNQKDYQGLLAWLAKVRFDSKLPGGAQHLGQGNAWQKVVFICTSAFEEKLYRDLLQKGWQRSDINQLISCISALYSFEDITFT